jgi:UDP-N-acetylglucosamine 2-epimerase (non-hydrolysing)
MSKVLFVYGTRPEAIKIAPLIDRTRSGGALEPVVAVTGQHREMLDQVNDLFGIAPEHDLDLMVHGAGLADIASRALAAVDRVVAAVAPDAMVVQGDTSTAFVAALASFYRQVPVVHLEAGLRTHTIHTPFPEEANRRLTAPLAALHLAPTSTSRANLVRETIDPGIIAVTGNTVIDALHTTVGVPVRFADERVEALVSDGGPLVLVTTHRRESWGPRMRAAMRGLRRVAEKQPEVRFLLPMHRNPVVRSVVEDELADLPNVLLTEPLSYHEFAHAMNASTVLLTDSGGVQEEAPSLGKPVLVMRESTERPEAVEAGTVKLVGTDTDVIAEELLALLTDASAYAAMANAVNPYGDGHASERCVAAMSELLGHGERLADFDPNPKES